MRRVRFLVWKELLELKDDRRLFGIVILAPILQLFMLGYAATTDVRHVPVVVAEDTRHGHACHLVEVTLQEHPAVALAGTNEGRQVVLVQRFERWDGLDAQALLDGRLAGDAINDDRDLDDAPERPLDKDGGYADQPPGRY